MGLLSILIYSPRQEFVAGRICPAATSRRPGILSRDEEITCTTTIPPYSRPAEPIRSAGCRRTVVTAAAAAEVVAAASLLTEYTADAD